MTISEPTTVLTDGALALLAGYLAARLWRDGAGRRQAAPRLLAATFVTLALGALLGAVSHGFVLQLGESAAAWVWRLTTWLVGATSFFLVVTATVATFAGAARQLLVGAAGLKLVAYWVWMTGHDGFGWVVLDYGSAMLVTAAFMALAVRRRAPDGSGAARWMLAAIAVSVGAAAVQLSGFSLHRNFNHNDMYHLVQMVGLYLFYRAGLLLDDA